MASIERSSAWASAAAALATLSLSWWVGHAAVASHAASGGLFHADEPSSAGFGSILLHILERNLPAALLLFSGVGTLAVSTVVASMLMGVYLGATFTIAADNAGTSQMLGSILAYGPLELLGFGAAATAGLLPLARLLLTRRADSASPGRPLGAYRRYGAAFPASLAMLATAMALLVVAAVVESAVIVHR